MNASAFILRVFSRLSPMLPAFIAAAVITVPVAVVLFIRAKKVWLTDRGFRLTGLFFGLDGAGAAKLASAWLRLIFILVFVVGFRKLTAVNYIMLLVPGIVGAFCTAGWKKKLSSLGWLALQTVNLFAVNLICGYIHDMAGGVWLYLIYIVMGIFLLLFSAYLFFSDLGEISEARHVDPEEVWGSEEDI